MKMLWTEIREGWRAMQYHLELSPLKTKAILYAEFSFPTVLSQEISSR